MRLSNKKLKYIKKHARRQSAEQIAQHLKLPPRVVINAIGRIEPPIRDSSRPPGSISLETLCFRLLAGTIFVLPLIVTDYLFDNVGGAKMILTMASALILSFLWFGHGCLKGGLKILRCDFYLPLLRHHPT